MPSDLNWIQHLQGMIAVMKNLVERDKLPASGIPMLVLGTEPLPNLYDQYNFGSNTVHIPILIDVLTEIKSASLFLAI